MMRDYNFMKVNVVVFFFFFFLTIFLIQIYLCVIVSVILLLVANSDEPRFYSAICTDIFHKQ